MTLRTVPADTDRYRFYLDEIQPGGKGLGGPTLRDMLIAACIHGDNEGVHDDVERAEEFAELLGKYRIHVQNALYLDLTVAEARELYEASLSAWKYADQNNYGADDEPDEDARLFGKHGEFVLHALAWPWEGLAFSDDGSHGFELVEN